ncbi:hypothetical protein [Streptomyces sp. NPDC001502]|uniref:hypothetical protein n=1 Tax=Streptomyces sp. NPDC001502 TaxID=3364578 RepID=UPI0036ADEC5E
MSLAEPEQDLVDRRGQLSHGPIRRRGALCLGRAPATARLRRDRTAGDRGQGLQSEVVLAELPATPARRRLSAVPQQATAPERVSFDAGEQPVPLLFARPDAEEKWDVPPMTESDPIEPLANQDDED